MKPLALLSLVTMVLAACATSPGPLVEAGYPTGSLAVAAIERADWATAERLLTDQRQLDRAHPARLINLGRVYAETGRMGEALVAWEQAVASPVQVDVQTADGRTARTDEVARAAIARYRARLQIAAAGGAH